MTTYSENTYKYISTLMEKETGMIIGPEKGYLIETRLSPLVRQHQLNGIDELADKSKNPIYYNIKQEIIDALTTNETTFFRDQIPFEHLKNYTLKQIKNKNIRIWSCACSTGQEAYSISILIDKIPEISRSHIQILGTDVSNTVLEKARNGIYSQFEVQRGLPTKDLITYFIQEGKDWKVIDKIKKNVNFEVGNVLSPKASLGKFDVVFCRNLLIYFNIETKKKAINSIYNQMNPGGHLYIGGAETLLGIHDGFTLSDVYHGLYIKK